MEPRGYYRAPSCSKAAQQQVNSRGPTAVTFADRVVQRGLTLSGRGRCFQLGHLLGSLQSLLTLAFVCRFVASQGTRLDTSRPHCLQSLDAIDTDSFSSKGQNLVLPGTVLEHFAVATDGWYKSQKPDAIVRQGCQCLATAPLPIQGVPQHRVQAKKLTETIRASARF